MFEPYNLANPPPATEEEKVIGDFFQDLFEKAEEEKSRQGLPNKWTYSYAMYHGDHWQKNRFVKKDRTKVSVNLFFANVNRTVSNVTARRPVAEVVDLEGGEDKMDMILTAKLRKWWKDTGQQFKLKETSLKMEKYGITIEHPIWRKRKEEFDVIIMDCFSAFPAPGNWRNLDEQPPYFCKAYADTTDNIEKRYGLERGAVKPDEVYSTLGEYREETRPVPMESYPGGGAASGNYADPNMRPAQPGTDSYLTSRALVVECWIRDESVVEAEEGMPMLAEDGSVVYIRPQGSMIYPDGVRVVAFTNRGDLVLDDYTNPNLNFAMDIDLVKQTYAWGRFPFYKVNSYLDTTSLWGFSAIDQVGELNKKVDEIMSRLLAWVMRVMFPPLIVAKETGITKAMLNNSPNLVLMPEKVAHVAGIRFEAVPNLPSNFIDILEVVIKFFDRIYQIEDADRGVGPAGVTAASAIVALQERNAVLIQEKISAVDSLVERRGKWCISMYQNMGISTESIEVDGESKVFKGSDAIGRKFNFVVESGSTMPRTSLQLEEQSKELYNMGVIDREALLEALNYPNWKKIIERAGEGQVDQALQILISAGLPEEEAMSLKEYVMQPDQGPGGGGPQQKSGIETTGAVPKAVQGGMPKPPMRSPTQMAKTA